MNRRIFANNIVVADLHAGIRAWQKAKILRKRTNDRAVTDPIVPAYRDLTRENGVRLNRSS